MKLKSKYNDSIYTIFVITMYILLFQNILQKNITIIKYFDEFLAIIAFFILLIEIVYKKKFLVKKYNIYIFVSIIGVIGCGLYSSLVYQYQPIKFAIMDIILVTKFFLVYCFANIINNDYEISKHQYKLVKHLKGITLFLFALTILNYILKIFPSSYRYGIMVNTLFFSYPTYLVACCVFLISGLLKWSSKIEYKYIFLLLFISATTLRMKAFVFIVTFIFIFFYITKYNSKITFFKVGIIIFICCVIAFDQIEYYFLNTTDIARTALVQTAFEIAKDYFPFGSGFATYASYFSTVSYSPIYHKYSIDKVYGLIEGNAGFATDAFWPMILGQFGYFGLFFYAISLLFILIKIQKNFSTENKNKYIAEIVIFAYLMISSTSESAFVNPLSIPLALLLGL